MKWQQWKYNPCSSATWGDMMECFNSGWSLSCPILLSIIRRIKISILALQKRREEMERLEKERQAEMRSYKGLMVAEKMTSNKQIASENKSLQELEDDFMWNNSI